MTNGYKYIPSKAVRDHYKKNKFSLNTGEIGWLIHDDYLLSVTDKIDAYKDLIKTAQDMEVDDDDNFAIETFQTRSYLTLLQKYVKILERSYKRFMKPNANSVYLVNLDYSRRENNTGSTICRSLEDCITVYKRCRRDSKYTVMYIRKVDLTKYNERELEYRDLGSAFINIHGVMETAYKITRKDNDDMFNLESMLFERVFINFKHPFKLGDILYDPSIAREDDDRNAYPFIAHKFADIGDGEEGIRRQYESGAVPGSITGLCHCYEPINRMFFNDHVGCCTRMEYYRGPLLKKMEKERDIFIPKVLSGDGSWEKDYYPFNQDD